ncbi:MAG: 2-C-methyl-D-erythritol 2,4-cyclodiphosphate synthase, partial [Clostridia bacterium]|nr:2-C-methyl-D-erythritol 2,4-cyclodiphosphate synthase [Clostridia bacterium]
MRAAGILLCAGSSQRMGFDKLLTPIAGQETALKRSAEILIAGGCDCLIAPADGEKQAYLQGLDLPVPLYFVAGGATRQGSVYNALMGARDQAGLGPEDIAVIHDGARCFVTPEVVKATILSAAETGSGVAASPMTDTVMARNEGAISIVDRTSLIRMQTPQSFRLGQIIRAHELVKNPAATDDCSLYLSAGWIPSFVEGGANNFKLTTPEDFTMAKQLLSAPCRMGTGFDTHVFAENRKLILGGVEVPYEKGLLGHSDADVLLHAIMDALLGAAALGDIGRHFPDTDGAYQDIDSRILLGRVGQLLKDRGYEIINIDATII